MVTRFISIRTACEVVIECHLRHASHARDIGSTTSHPVIGHLFHGQYIYAMSVIVSKLQVAILARSSRYRGVKLFVSTESTSCHEFAFQFGPEFFIREKHSKPRGNRAASASVNYNGQRPAIVASGAGRHGWVPQTHRIAIT